MPSGLPWRAGAAAIDADADMAPILDLQYEAPEDPGPLAPPLDSIARLVAQKQASGDMGRWKHAIRALPATSSQTLILRIGTATDALTLWALHSQLDQRGIPPCLRWPGNSDTPQLQLISWLADLLWFTKRNRTHQAKFKSWQRLMQDAPGSVQWHERAYRIFNGMYGRQNVTSYTARGLGLEHAQRYDLMTLPTSRMVTARRELQPDTFAETREKLLSHAMVHPDKSGQHAPDTVAERRARLWRVHVLSRKRPAESARNWALLTGETTTRQVIARQIDAIEAVLNAG